MVGSIGKRQIPFDVIKKISVANNLLLFPLQTEAVFNGSSPSISSPHHPSVPQLPSRVGLHGIQRMGPVSSKKKKKKNITQDDQAVSFLFLILDF